MMSCICAFWSGHVGAAAGCRCRVLLQGAAVRVVCAFWSPHVGAAAGQGATTGCCFKVLLLEWCVRFRAGMLVPLQGAPSGCCFRVLLLEWCVRFGTLLVTAGCCLGAAVRVARVRFGAGLLVPLLRVALSFELACFCRCCVLLSVWSWSAGAATGCRCSCCFRVLLLEWRVRFGAGLLVPLHGATARCHCTMPLQGVAGCCQSGVCALELAAGAAAGCCFRVLLLEWRVRFGAGVAVQDRCCFRVLLLEWCVRFGAGLLVLLRGAAAGCCRQSAACAV